MEEHASRCEGPVRDRLVLARDAVMAMEMLHSHELGVYASAKVHPHLLIVEVDAATTETVGFPQVWARRPKQGYTLGANATGHFVADIQSYFLSGATRKESRMSAP